MWRPKPGLDNEGKSISTQPSLAKYVNEFGISAEVSQQPQLNLTVVCGYEDTAWSRHKGIPDVHLLLA